WPGLRWAVNSSVIRGKSSAFASPTVSSFGFGVALVLVISASVPFRKPALPRNLPRFSYDIRHRLRSTYPRPDIAAPNQVRARPLKHREHTFHRQSDIAPGP